MIKKEAPLYIFLLFALLVILYHIFGYFGHFGYDDMLYARIAKNWTDGQVHYDNAFSYRFTIIALTALSYLILGVNDPASAIPPIIVSISILFIIYITLRREGTLQTIFGLALTLSINAFIFYSDKIMPDIYVALFLLLSIFLYNYNRFVSNRMAMLHGSLFALSLFLAFCSKETAVLFLPLPALLLITDLIRKRSVRFWISAAASALIITSVYLIIIRVLTGSYLTRFDVLAANNQSQTFLYSYDKLPFSHLLNRVSYELLSAYLKEGLFVSFALIITALLFSDFRKLLRINDTRSLFMAASLVLLVSVNFMTISPFSYHPVPTELRHSLFIIPFAAIAASYVMKDYLTGKRYRFELPGIFAVLSVAAIFTDKSTAFRLYIPLTLLFIACSLVRNTKAKTIIFSSLIIIVLFIKPSLFFHNSAVNVKYRMQKDIFISHFIKPGEPCYVITDPVQKNFGEYYTGFDPASPCRFVDFTKINDYRFEPNMRKYLFLNWHTRFFSQTHDNLPYFAQCIDSTYKPVYENPGQNIYIYELEDVLIPERDGEKIFETNNDFEKNHLFWTPSNSEIITHKEKSGNRIYRTGEYSVMLSVPVDTLVGAKPVNLLVRCRFRGYFHTVPTSFLVVNVEDENSVISWNGKELGNRISVIRQWQTVDFDFIIRKEYIKPERFLKIFIWNPGGDSVYLDDFGVVIFGIPPRGIITDNTKGIK